MKANQFLATLLSTVAVAGGAFLATSPAEACPFSERYTSKSSATQSLDSFQSANKQFPFKLAVLGGAGIAALAAGAFAARRLAKDGTPSHPEFSSTDELIPAKEIFQAETTDAPVAAAAESTSEKETTLVR